LRLVTDNCLATTFDNHCRIFISKAEILLFRWNLDAFVDPLFRVDDGQVHVFDKHPETLEGRLTKYINPEILTLSNGNLQVIRSKENECEETQAALAESLQQADILISGVGKANLIKADLVKQGAVVIDFGFDRFNDQICGDVESNTQEKALIFTPTPGGTGPLLVSMIFDNLYQLLTKAK